MILTCVVKIKTLINVQVEIVTAKKTMVIYMNTSELASWCFPDGK